ncbi:MAG TPA: hypothetical protein VHH34_14380 [Pseudonocardiaceae bacterium]|nr:hypothetical protein [Pseudonocardiaceae bacterium]
MHHHNKEPDRYHALTPARQLTLAHPRPVPAQPTRGVFGWVDPAVLIVVLAGLAAAGAAVAAVALVVAAPGQALVTAGLLGVGGWLVKTTVAVVPGPVLAGVAAAVLGWPWLLLAVLAWLAVRGRS